MIQALDFSWQPPDPDAFAAVGIGRALSYTGNVRPSQEYLDALAERGVLFTFIQETYSERALEGWQAGVYDAQFADGRADQRHYPLHQSICYVVSDRSSSNPNSGGEAIAQYAAGIAAASKRPRFYYGNRYAVEWALAGDPAAIGAWLPVTWGFDPDRDLMAQESNTAPPIEGTDLNTVYREYAFAGGPAIPGGPLPDPPEDDEMPVNYRFIFNGPNDDGVGGAIDVLLADGTLLLNFGDPIGPTCIDVFVTEGQFHDTRRQHFPPALDQPIPVPPAPGDFDVAAARARVHEAVLNGPVATDKNRAILADIAAAAV